MRNVARHRFFNYDGARACEVQKNEGNFPTPDLLAACSQPSRFGTPKISQIMLDTAGQIPASFPFSPLF